MKRKPRITAFLESAVKRSPGGYGGPCLFISPAAKWHLEAVKAEWLLQVIGMAQIGIAALHRQPWQCWKLLRFADGLGLFCADRRGELLYAARIGEAAAPAAGITLHIARNTIYLPGEDGEA